MKTIICAHRGASADAPENTMLAFKEALAQGAEMIELDVQMSKDGYLMVIHDETLQRTTDGQGLVVDYTLEELRKYNAKYTFTELDFTAIPTLDEVLAWAVETQVELNIELKNGVVRYGKMEEECVRLIKHYAMDERVCISSFNHYSLLKIHQIAPEIRTAILYIAGLVEPWEYAKKIGTHGLHPFFYSVTPELVEEAHRAGLAVRPYTVDDPERMKSLIELGVDAIITNMPGMMKKIRGGYT